MSSHRHRKLRRLIFGSLVVLVGISVYAIFSSPQPGPELTDSPLRTVIVKWSAPDSGQPADRYVVKLSRADVICSMDTTSAESSLVLVNDARGDYKFSIASLDAEGRSGPFSEPIRLDSLARTNAFRTRVIEGYPAGTQDLAVKVDDRPPQNLPVLRNTDVAFPATVDLGEWAELRVMINRAQRILSTGEAVVVSPETPHDIQFAIDPAAASDAAGRVRIDVKVYAADFEIEEPSRRSVEMSLYADSPPLFFRLKARRPGDHEINVYFYQNARYLGEVVLQTRVDPPADASIVTRQAGPHAPIPAPSKGARLRIAPGARSPDLQIHVYATETDTAGTHLKFDLQSPSRALDIGLDTDHVVADGMTPTQWVDRALAELETALRRGDTPYNRQRIRTHVMSTGRAVYQGFFPPKLRRIIEENPRLESILILSEEPDIPWEMAFIDDPDHPDGGQFLCEKFAVTRWLVGAGEAPQSVALSRVAMLGVGDDPRLAASVEAERQVLARFRDRGVIVEMLEPRFDQVLRSLCDDDVGVYHFACHGLYDDEFSEITLSDGPFRVIYLNDPDCQHRNVRPFVFMNACQTGRVGDSLGGMAGWTAGFLDAGAAVFVGPIWSIQTEASCRFAGLLYAGLGDGLTLGAAVQQARLETRRLEEEREGGDPAFSWLAYTVYGDPNARFAYPGD